MNSSAVSLDQLGRTHGTDKASTGHDYLRHYEYFLSGLRDEAFRLVEIGGLNGSSLKMWADYFPRAEIVCVDINPDLRSQASDRVAVEIGNSGSEAFLTSLRDKYGTAAVVLDDGSHRWDHQRVAFQTLFDMVEPGGFYVIEDIHTSYEPGFAGADVQPFTDLLKTLVDYLHLRGEHRKVFERRFPARLVALAKEIDWICFVPRSCVIKRKGSRTALRPVSYADVGAADLLTSQPEPRVPLRRPEVTGAVTRKATVVPLDVPADYLVRLRDVVCHPRQVLLQGRGLLPDSFRRYDPRHAHVRLAPSPGGGFVLRPQSDAPVEELGGPVFYLDAEHPDHYGHVTLELMSRLWCYDDPHLREATFLTSSRKRPLLEALLEPLGIAGSRVRTFSAPVRCADLLVSNQAYVLERSVSPNAFKVWDAIGDAYARPGTSERIYVSRSAWGKQRVLQNEGEVEDLFRRYDFEVVVPEALPVSEQVRLFRGARVIAGPSGSGLYNCVYSRGGQRLILASDKFLTSNDALVNARGEAQVSYVAGRVQDPELPGMQAPWVIDLADVRQALERLTASVR